MRQNLIWKYCHLFLVKLGNDFQVEECIFHSSIRSFGQRRRTQKCLCLWWGAHWITNWQLKWNMIVNLYAQNFVFRLCSSARAYDIRFTRLQFPQRQNHPKFRTTKCSRGMPTNDKTTDTNKWLITFRISIDNFDERRKEVPIGMELGQATSTPN